MGFACPKHRRGWCGGCGVARAIINRDKRERVDVFKLFSADDHLIEHGRVWSDRLPAKYQEAGPHVVEEEGGEYWVYEGQKGASPGRFGAPVEIREKIRSNEAFNRPTRYEEMLPGCYDPAERTHDMLANGVLASVCFPSFPRFAGVLFTTFRDLELSGLCVKAYNDFVLDEWCTGGPPGMFVPLIIGQLWNPPAVAAEVRRCAAKGARAISLPENTVPLGLPSYYSTEWDPVWEACQETETVVCLHIGTSGQVAEPTPEAPNTMSVRITLMPGIGSQIALVNLLFSPVCLKFPGLKFVLSESGIGWASYAVDRADLVWERYHTEGDRRPSEIFEQNFFLCQVEERVGPKVVERLGPNKVLWELDYPHQDTSWPFAQESAVGVFDEAQISKEDFDLMTWGNAAKVFSWTPASTDLLDDPSNAAVATP
jgi:predicted TIM-barrel fold metal-dependent hydrolase